MIKNKPKFITAIILIYLLFPVLTHAAGYDFFVDMNSTEATEDGSEQFPWKSVNAAIGSIERAKLKGKKVFVKNGTYPEAVILTNNISLFGESRDGTVIDAERNNYGVHFKSTSSRLANLTVKNAETNLEVDKKSKALIENCDFTDARQSGAVIEKAKASNRYKFTLKNSSVQNSGKRGIYIFRRKVEISGNTIMGNNEEGIDLHTNVRGKISANEIKDNGESGIETMISGASIGIRGNNISGNGTQGISIQFYNSVKGKATISKNGIRSNGKYGIRYARYDHGKIKTKYQDFVKKCVKVSGNTISENGDGKYSYL